MAVPDRTGRSWPALVAILLLFITAGCASIPAPSWPTARADSERPVPTFREVRPERAADYDVLVAELAKADRDLERAREAYLRAAEKDREAVLIEARRLLTTRPHL